LKINNFNKIINNLPNKIILFVDVIFQKIKIIKTRAIMLYSYLQYIHTICHNDIISSLHNNVTDNRHSIITEFNDVVIKDYYNDILYCRCGFINNIKELFINMFEKYVEKRRNINHNCNYEKPIIFFYKKMNF